MKQHRFINIEGSVNLRDFGGYTTTTGKQVRRGLLFRCGNMAEIPEHAFSDFAALDIGVICDLRSHEEAETSPTPEGGPFACRVHIPIWPGSASTIDLATTAVVVLQVNLTARSLVPALS